MPNAIDPYRKRPYVPHVEGNDQGRRTGWPPGMLQDDSRELSKWLSQPTRARSVGDPDNWDAAGVAEEGKAGAQMLGRLMVAIAFVALVAGWAVLG